MKKLFIFKGLSLALCLSASLCAEQFAFHNKTKANIAIALGTESNPPQADQILVLGAGAIIDKVIEINRDDAPQLLLILEDDLKYTFQLNAAQGTDIKLKLTVSLINGKVNLVPQLAPNNIKKDEIKLVSMGSV
jgi:hypothetical protein